MGWGIWETGYFGIYVFRKYGYSKLGIWVTEFGTLGCIMTKTKDPYGRNTSTVYRRKCRELKNSAKGKVCCICNRAIDTSLPPEAAHDPVLWAEYWSAEHDPPLSQGGKLLNIKGPAHQGCNSDLGRRLQAATATIGVIEHSVSWFGSS